MILGPPNLVSTVERFSMAMALRDYAPDSTTPDGMIAAGATVDTPIVGHYFPAKGDDVERLELQSPGSVYECHIPAAPVLIARKGSQQRGSVLVFDGRTFEVVELGQWFHGVGTTGYRQCFAQEVLR